MLGTMVECINAHAHAFEEGEAAALDFSQGIAVGVVNEVLGFPRMGKGIKLFDHDLNGHIISGTCRNVDRGYVPEHWRWLRDDTWYSVH